MRGLTLGMGMGLPLEQRPATSSPPPSNWILATGFWDDDGVWNDDAVWID